MITTNRFLLIACGITLLLRIAAIVVAPPVNVAKYEQLAIAQNAVEGRGFGMVWPYEPADTSRASLWHSNTVGYPSAFMPPFIPMAATTFLAITKDINSAVAILLVIQVVLGSMIPLLVYAAGIRVGDERTARYAVMASLFFTPGLLTSATPAGAVFYSIAGLMVVIYAHDVFVRRRQAIGLGLSLGLLTLMRAEALGLGVLMCVLVVFFKRDGTSVKHAALALITMLVVVAPWTLRNTIAFGSVVPVVSHPWREAWRGFNEQATGSGYSAEGWEIWEGEHYPHITTALDSIPLNQKYELEADKVFKKEVAEFVSENPGSAAFLIVKKMLMFWTYDPYYPRGAHPAFAIPTVLCSFLVLLGFGAMLKRDKYRIVPALVPYFFIAAFYSLVIAFTYVMPRYQAYVFSILLPVAGHGMALVRTRLLSLRGSS